MRECECAKPSRSANPRHPESCVCGLWINPEWDANDENVTAFFERLAEGLFPYDRSTGQLSTEPWFDSFRDHCVRRERHGRIQFGHEYLRRDNPVEAMEEAADGVLYLMLDALKARRGGLGDEDIDVVLTAARHFAEAHRTLNVLRSKRHHAPA